MIKTTLKLFLGGLTSLLIKQAAGQIPNASFEQWDTTQFFTYEVINPKGWISNNLYNVFNDMPYSATPTNDSYSGKYALRIENHYDSNTNYMPSMVSTYNGDYVSDGNNMFPVQGKVLQLKGFYKYSSPEHDSFEVNIVLYKNSQIVGSGYMFSSIQSLTYLPFTVHATYDFDSIPDSASINISSSASEKVVFGSTLYIDDLSLVYQTTGIAKSSVIDGALSVFPNPASDFLSLTFNLNSSQNLDINVYDITGKLVSVLANNKNYNAGQNQSTHSLAGFTQGMYFVSIQPQNGSAISQKFIVK